MASDLEEVLMPSMGEGVNEATLVKWLKNTGDKVEKNEPLLEVSTDKVDTEITSPHSGFLIKTYANPDDTVTVNNIIAYLSKSPDATAPDKVTQASQPTATSNMSVENTQTPHTAPPPQQIPISSGGPVKTSPLVRKMARDMNLNLAAVAGRGLHGRITKLDVLNFIDKIGGQINQPNAAPIVGISTSLQTEQQQGKEFLEGVEVRRESMNKMRRLIADHMVQSVQTSPHVTTTFEMDLSKIVEQRESLKAEFKAKHNFNLTYTHFLAHATVQAIKKNMIVNVSVDKHDVLWKDDINLGIAVALESGLIVPVIKKSNDLSLPELAFKITDIVTRARSKKLKPDEVQGGTFSITNPGLYGSLNSNPIINQPQVAILNVGAIIKRPVVRNDDIVVRPLIQIGLTFDHRVVDGEGGAKFLADLKEIIENYETKL